MIDSSSTLPYTTIQPNYGNVLVNTKDFDDEDTKAKVENKNTKDSINPALKQSSMHSESKQYSTYSDYILMKNKINI